MTSLTMIAAGLGVGLVIGFGLEYAPVPPIVQTLVAVAVACVAGAIAAAAVWWMTIMRTGSGGIGAVSAGCSELLAPLGIAAVAAVLHVALGRVAPFAPWVVKHRAMVLGGLAGLLSAVSMARTMAAAF